MPSDTVNFHFTRKAGGDSVLFRLLVKRFFPLLGSGNTSGNSDSQPGHNTQIDSGQPNRLHPFG